MSHSPQKIGPILLSGLMIGPVLGSGIVLLPPIIYSRIGDYAVVAWAVIQLVGFAYAYLCGQLSIIFPGDSGLAVAVESAYGPRMRKLAANFLIFAAFMGPVAVLMTAGRYLSFWLHGMENYTEIYGFALMILSYLILLLHISKMSRVLLLLSTTVAALLLIGSMSSVTSFRSGPLFITDFNLKSFGYSILLLFWSVAGWEIIGNYSVEVRERRRTITRAVLYSTITIALVSISVAAATQWLDYSRLDTSGQERLLITAILIPLSGNLALPLFAILTAGLCISTFLLVVGGVSRLIADQAGNGVLPVLLSYRSSAQVPVLGLSLLLCMHTFVFALLYLKITDIENIVAFANAFFICNALLGVVAAARLLRGWFLRTVSVLLTIAFLSILSFSSLWALSAIAAVVVFQFRYYLSRPTCPRKKNTRTE